MNTVDEHPETKGVDLFNDTLQLDFTTGDLFQIDLSLWFKADVNPLRRILKADLSLELISSTIDATVQAKDH